MYSLANQLILITEMEQKSANGAPQTSRSSFGFLPFFCGTAGFGKFSGMFENGQRWGFEYSQDEAGRFYGQARLVTTKLTLVAVAPWPR